MKRKKVMNKGKLCGDGKQYEIKERRTRERKGKREKEEERVEKQKCKGKENGG